MRDSFDNDENPLEGLQILSTDNVEDIAALLRWKHEVLLPFQQPRRSVEVPKPEDVSVLARRKESRRAK